MLTRLAITNLATIQFLDVEFGGGFTVLTGETGAGKSILIGALRLVLGGRASADQVRGGEKQTVVEACFDISRLPEVRRQLAELDIPQEGELVLRRMLQDTGRSRALANDCAITQARLEALGRYLVDIHGQHDNQLLLDPATHVDFLDAFGGLLAARSQVAEVHGRYAELQRRRAELEQKAQARERRRSALEETAEEIRAAGLKPGEEESLRQELQRLTHAEHLAQLATGACEILNDGEAPVLSRLADLRQVLGEAAAIDPALVTQANQLPPAVYQLDDLYRALRSYAARMEADPARLEWINTRLAQIERLTRKYGGGVPAALERLAAAEADLAELDRMDVALEQVQKDLGEVAGRLHALSSDLSAQRHLAATALDQRLVAQLQELGMTKAHFETRVATGRTAGGAPEYTGKGIDDVEFLLSANPGQGPRPLAKIASGGELSRTMLGLKTVLAEADPTRTLIFDEVDAGISGAMAEVVGHKLRGLGRSHQVLCVTHLPQIAALASGHCQVAKETDGRQTFTRITRLNEEEAVQEVARLLSGLEVTGHALASARQMVRAGRRADV